MQRNKILLALALLLGTVASQAVSQTPARDFGGWSRASSGSTGGAASGPSEVVPASSGVTTAFYQSQSGGDGLPALPSFPTTSSASGALSDAPQLPPSRGPAGLPAAQLPAGLQDLPPGTPASPPPLMQQNSPRNGIPARDREEVLPPSSGNALANNRSLVPGGGMPNAVQGNRGMTTGQNNTTFGSQPVGGLRSQEVAYQTEQGLRAIENERNQPNNRINPNTVTSGLPYVTPPPQGRYPTSTYNYALFRNAAYQRQAIAASQNLATTPQMLPGQLVSAQVPAPQAVLPQFQGLPGVYPTAYQQCAPNIGPPTLPATNAVPGSYVPPTYTPNMAPQLYSPNNSGYAPLFSLGQEGYNVLLGRGLIGQPTVYVPGQPVRNFLRYISP